MLGERREPTHFRRRGHRTESSQERRPRAIRSTWLPRSRPPLMHAQRPNPPSTRGEIESPCTLVQWIARWRLPVLSRRFGLQSAGWRKRSTRSKRVRRSTTNPTVPIGAQVGQLYRSLLARVSHVASDCFWPIVPIRESLLCRWPAWSSCRAGSFLTIDHAPSVAALDRRCGDVPAGTSS